MLELINFGHIFTSTISFDSPDKILLVTSWTKVGAVIFANIIKIVTIFYKNNLWRLKKCLKN